MTAPFIGPGVSVVRVEWTYNISEAPPPLNEQWADCAACRKRHNHKRGFVVLLSDEQFATVGFHCGQTKHDLEYREHLAVFEERRKRHRTLRRVIAAFSYFVELATANTKCRVDAGYRTLIDRRRMFPQSFAALWKLLSEHPDGVLYGTVLERNYDAERARDSRYDTKLTELARRLGLSRDNRDHEAQLVAELAGDPDTSKEPIMQSVRRATGQYQGASFISRLSRTQEQLADIYYRALHALDDIDGKNTATLTTARLDSAAKRFAQIARDQIKLQEDLAAAVAFLDPANLMAIVRWINQSTRWRDQAGGLTVRSGALHLGKASMSLALPPLQLATLNHILREVTGEA